MRTQKRRRHNHNLNGWGSMRVAGLVADTVSAADARGPRCDRNSAFCASVKVGDNVVKNCSSKQLAARCCQPNLGSVGSACRSIVGGVSARTIHVGMTNPTSRRVSAQSLTAWKQWATMVDSSQHDFCHFWVPLLDHMNAIGPTGPMGCHCGPCSATQPHPTLRQRQIGQHPGQLWCPFNAQKGLQTPPHIEVVALGEILNLVWSHHVHPEVGTCRPTHQKQQPRRLSVLHLRNTVEEGLLFN